MGVDFSTLILQPNYDTWARDMQFTPLTSQPGAGAYWARGILRSQGTMISTGEEWVELSDQKPEIDIREAEFTVLPQQGDLIYVPDDGNMRGGTFEVTDVSHNGGGEMTMNVRKWEPADPTPVGTGRLRVIE
jgi:hypothetical protein